MKTHRYLPLVPLLLFAAGCQPEPEQPGPAQPDNGAAAATSAAFDNGSSEGTRPAPAAVPKRMAEVKIAATEGHEAGGMVRFLPDGGTTRIEGRITGLEPGAHGLHIHTTGDCSAPDAKSAGGHFSPDDDPHGSPADLPDAHHTGDLGNVVAGDDGTAEVIAEDEEIRLTGPDSVIGKALIVHAGRDDLQTQPSGDSGARVGCGVIREAVQTAERGARTAATEGGETGA